MEKKNYNLDTCRSFLESLASLASRALCPNGSREKNTSCWWMFDLHS